MTIKDWNVIDSEFEQIEREDVPNAMHLCKACHARRLGDKKTSSWIYFISQGVQSCDHDWHWVQSKENRLRDKEGKYVGCKKQLEY